MTKVVIGADRVRKKLKRLPEIYRREMAKANARNGEDLIRVARVVHPGSGSTKAQITGSARSDGSYLADFGPKAKVTEGRSGPRPFVNPAKKATEKRRKARYRRASNKAVKEAMRG